MKINPQSALRLPHSLRGQLFISSALLTSLILVVAAWAINHQFVRQARQQVQTEVETLLPLYDAVWHGQARRLAAIGATMANSPIIKTVFGDARAARDGETLREMVVDMRNEPAEAGDLILLSDGAGQIIFAEQQGGAPPAVTELPAARAASESQTAEQSFTLLGDRLFQLVLTPVLLHSGSADYNQTLAVVGTGSELNAAVAAAVKRRIHSEVIFFVGDRIHASSLAPEAELRARDAIATSSVFIDGRGHAASTRPTEISIGDDLYLAFARQLTDFDGAPIGQVVVLRSLAGAGQLFRAISNRLLLLWTLALICAWLFSFLIAERITKSLEALAAGARAFGQGRYDFPVPTAAHGETGQLARAFDQMRQSLQQSQAALLKNERLATIGQMASSIIHDLRNPLATIATAAEVMSNDGLPNERRRTMLETQLRAAERMNVMLTELLEFSRGNYKLHRQPQPLNSIVQRVAHELGAQMAQLGIKLTLDIPAAIVIAADAERLARVFENLLINAIQALPQGGAIEIRATTEDGLARVGVIDNGPGIPAPIRARLFEPFISHGKQGGTGLGLAIARGIVEAHGGQIGLANKAARGAHFWIELPQAPLPAPARGEYAQQSVAG